MILLSVTNNTQLTTRCHSSSRRRNQRLSQVGEESNSSTLVPAATVTLRHNSLLSPAIVPASVPVVCSVRLAGTPRSDLHFVLLLEHTMPQTGNSGRSPKAPRAVTVSISFKGGPSERSTRSALKSFKCFKSS